MSKEHDKQTCRPFPHYSFCVKCQAKKMPSFKLLWYDLIRESKPKLTQSNRRDGVVVRASASQSVDLGFIPLVESYQKTLKNGIYSFPVGARHLWEVVENKPASSLVVSLGKALNGMPPPLCGRQVAHKPRKRQLPSECGFPSKV